MKIFVSIKTNAKQEKVEKLDNAHFKVSVTAIPVEGKANQALIKILANYFKVAPSTISILSGHKAKHKVVEVIMGK